MLPLDIRIIMAAIIIAVVSGAGWLTYHAIETNAYDRGYASAEAEWKDKQAQADARAKSAALAKERQFQTTLKEAHDAAKKREQVLLADADRARTESERLRGDLGAIRAKLPSLTEAAVRRYADTASVVFDQCQRRYQELAGIADQCHSDLKTVTDAWPR